jgi:Synergist-CTERM protein sorting domain-containing protein
MQWYDSTKALTKLASGEVSNLPAATLNNYPLLRDYTWVKDNSGDGSRQPFKFEVTWQGWSLRERARPTAYIFEGPYAAEVASRMLIAGIDVKRLANDVTLSVEGWHYNTAPSVDFRNSGSGGWGVNNRNVSIYPVNNRRFTKDSYVVFLGQVLTNLIPMYMEPDMPFSAGNGIMLTYMSVAAGGNSSGVLHSSLIGRQMPIYRYLGDVNAINTYDMDFFLPLINRGAVPRFFGFHTQEEVADIAIKARTGSSKIRVYDYDIQVHARHGNRTTEPALKDGRFDMVLPTDEDTKGYLILKKDGTYAELKPHSKMLGWNVVTIVVADQNVPFTVNLSVDNRPEVGDGSNRTIPRALPHWDDLIGVRIIEIAKNEIEKLFKELPAGAVTTDKGIELTNMINRRGVLLSNAMLDGWRIVAVDPQSGANWRTNMINDELVVTFNGDAYNKVTVVTLQKIGSTETFELEVMFSGEWDIREQIGCNVGIMAVLALFALIPLFVRRKN